MDKWIFELFLESIVAFETEFPLGARLQLEFVLGKRNRNNQEGNDEQ
jgi:hypothetical protein